MKAHTIITAIVLASLLSGCGVKRDEHQRVVDDLKQAKQQLEEARQEASQLGITLANLESALSTARQSTSRLETELQGSRARITAMTAEIDRLKKQDSYAFNEAGRRLDAGDLAGAMQAYQNFVRDFPSSPQVSAATTQIQQIGQRLESNRREAASRLEREQQQQAQRELAERIRAGNFTAAQWWQVLRGKTMEQVKDLLGTPGFTTDEDRRWTYYDRAIAPNSGKHEMLRVYFRGGVVVATQGESSDSLISD